MEKKWKKMKKKKWFQQLLFNVIFHAKIQVNRISEQAYVILNILLLYLSEKRPHSPIVFLY